jgi:hypothetical protein
MPNKENEFELDLATRAYIADLAMEAQRLTSMRLGALNLVVRQHGLQGQWDLAPDGSKLIRVDAQPTLVDQNAA